MIQPTRPGDATHRLNQSHAIALLATILGDLRINVLEAGDVCALGIAHRRN